MPVGGDPHLRQLQAGNPKGVIGLFDITARKVIKSALGDHLMTVSLPYPLFLEMESEGDRSFLCKENWEELTTAKVPR